MRSTSLLASMATLLTTHVSGLGINCRGSGLCPLATWDNQSPLPVMQILRDAIYQSKVPDTTPFNSGDHVICVSNTITINLTLPIIDPTGLTSGLGLGSWHLGGNLKDGGICLFPQYLKDGPITLGSIRKLVDKLLEHGCETCGSVPIHFVDRGSNDPGDGILTFNYVRHPYCTENCLTDGLVGASNKTMAAAQEEKTKTLLGRGSMSVPAAVKAAVESDSPNAHLGRSIPAAAEDESKGWNNTVAAAVVAAKVEKERAVKRNAVFAPFNSDTEETKQVRKKPKRATKENAEKKRVMFSPLFVDEGSETVERKQELSTRSVKFADLAPRVHIGARGYKGWIGWLRR